MLQIIADSLLIATLQPVPRHPQTGIDDDHAPVRRDSDARRRRQWFSLIGLRF